MTALFYENLKRLRESENDWDKADILQMQSWAKRMSHLVLEKSYREHEITKEIVEKIRDEVRDINHTLLNAETTEENRKRALILRDAFEWYLSLFVDDPAKEIKMLEEEVIDQLTAKRGSEAVWDEDSEVE